MATDRYRMRFDFQLNVAKDEEYAIDEQIGSLKKQGLYSKTVRDGIRLVSNLRDGNLDVLFELFPWVQAEFLEYVAGVQPEKSETERDIQQQLLRIEKLLATSEMEVRAGGPKAMKVSTVAGPRLDFDDNVALTRKKAKSSGNSAQNFLNSALNLVQ
ncbi:MAG: hypothetical protein CL610_19995 [Anaerolineaceae bacterium]|nr:hypothetical protein [Anaerolineaceae bacterium]